MAETPEIVAYLKPVCGWSSGVREVFRKYDLVYEDKDIINNPEIYAEMVQKSGQPLSPCVVVNGQVLATVASMLSDLLVSEGSRRKVRVEVEREVKRENITDIAQLFRDRLAK